MAGRAVLCPLRAIGPKTGAHGVARPAIFVFDLCFIYVHLWLTVSLPRLPSCLQIPLLTTGFRPSAPYAGLFRIDAKPPSHKLSP